MTTVAENPTDVAYSVEIATGATLARALKNALLCVSADEYLLPAIAAVQVSLEGSRLRLVATDRFLLIVEDLVVEVQEQPWRFLLPRAACAQALTFLKGNAKQPVTVEWAPANTHEEWAAGSVTIRGYEGAATFTAIDSPPPKVLQLLPNPDQRVAVDSIGFTRKNLVVLGKIDSASRNDFIRVSTFGATRPVRIDWTDEARTLLVMPAKVTDAAWGVTG